MLISLDTFLIFATFRSAMLACKESYKAAKDQCHNYDNP